MPAIANAKSKSALEAYELTLTRTFDAPRELVFQAWTDPRQLAQWWGPHHFTISRCELDARAGGAVVIDMRGPDGTIYPSHGVFEEVVAPERIVMKLSVPGPDGNVLFEVRNSAKFEERAGKTTLTLTAEVVMMQPGAEMYLNGMREGWTQTLERLGSFLTKPEDTSGREIVAKRVVDAPREEELKKMSGSEEFVMSRVFNAPIDVVYRAWAEPEQLQKWFGPKGASIFHSKGDAKPGGTYHYGMRTPDGNEIWGKWIYREIVPNERLVFVNSFSDKDGGITRHPMAPTWPLEMLSTIEFTGEGGKTRVTVRWSPLNATEAERKTFTDGMPSMKGGWTGTLDRLDAYLAEV